MKKNRAGGMEMNRDNLQKLIDNQCHLDKVFYDENSISYAVMH